MIEKIKKFEGEPVVGFDVVDDKKCKTFILKPKNTVSEELMNKYSRLLQGYALNAKKSSEQSIQGGIEQIPYGDSIKGLVLPYINDSGPETARTKMEKIKLFLENEKGVEEVEKSYEETQELIAQHEKKIFDNGKRVFQASQES